MDQQAPSQPQPEPTLPAGTVTLRPFDVDAMMAWASDPVVTAFMTWDPYTSRAPLLAFLRDTVLPHPWFRAGRGVSDADGRPVPRRARRRGGARALGQGRGHGGPEADGRRGVRRPGGRGARGGARRRRQRGGRPCCGATAWSRAGSVMVIYSFISTDPLVE